MSRKANNESPAQVEMVSVPAAALRRHLDKISREYQTDPAPISELRSALEASQAGR